MTFQDLRLPALVHIESTINTRARVPPVSSAVTASRYVVYPEPNVRCAWCVPPPKWQRGRA